VAASPAKANSPPISSRSRDPSTALGMTIHGKWDDNFMKERAPCSPISGARRGLFN